MIVRVLEKTLGQRCVKQRQNEHLRLSLSESAQAGDFCHRFAHLNHTPNGKSPTSCGCRPNGHTRLLRFCGGSLPPRPPSIHSSPAVSLPREPISPLCAAHKTLTLRGRFFWPAHVTLLIPRVPQKGTGNSQTSCWVFPFLIPT